MFNHRFFKVYLLPGIAFQSLVVAGGYCTGQEINQYFLSLGPVNGMYALLITCICWSILCALAFTFAKAFQAYDYKTFFKALLGKASIAFDICYVYIMIIVLSVVTAAAGSLLEKQLGLPYNIGLLFPLAYIFYMVLKGSSAIIKMFSFLSIGLYLVFSAFLICCYQKTNISITAPLLALPSGFAWIKNGFTYASYNIGPIFAILYTLRHFSSYKQAVVSGLLVGPFACLPALLLYLALLTEYPAILHSTVPSAYILDKLAFPLLTFSFSFILFGCLIETGVGLVHAFNSSLVLKKHHRILTLVVLLALTFGLAQFGLVALIAKGYSILSCLMVLVFIVPLLTIGVVKIIPHIQNQ
jgi:uncharacterized membrane protein YkvI